MQNYLVTAAKLADELSCWSMLPCQGHGVVQKVSFHRTILGFNLQALDKERKIAKHTKVFASRVLRSISFASESSENS